MRIVVEYEVVDMDVYQCDNCGLVTLSKLCGCPNAKPIKCGTSPVWFPQDTRTGDQ